MNTDTTPGNVYMRAAALGVVAGIRSMTPLALLQKTSDQDTDNSMLTHLLHSRNTELITMLAAVAESFGDKLPFIPSRTSTGPLVGRLAIGALASMTICKRNNESLVLGAALGALGAGIGAFVSSYSRTRLSRATKMPDFVLGLTEDAVAVGLGSFAVGKED